MKFTILLALAAVLSVGDSTSVVKAGRQNLVVGSILPGCRILYRVTIYKPAIANVIQREDVVYRGTAKTTISSVQAFEMGLTQRASAQIISGGVSRSDVTIRFSSARGMGYHYTLSIWGR